MADRGDWRVALRHRGLGLWVLVGTALIPPTASAQANRGVVQLRSFDAPSLGVRKRFVVYLPPSYAAGHSRRYPVLYLLHGLGGNESDWIARIGLDIVADSLASASRVELIVVMPDGDNGFYANWSSSPGFDACARDTTLAESASTFCVRTSRYGDYIAHDLVDQVDATFRTMADRAHRAVAGLSMGATGALTLALTYPAVFSAVASLSAPASPLYVGPRPFRPPAQYALTMEEWEQFHRRPMSAPWRARWGSDTSTWWRQDPIRAARHLVASGAALPRIEMEVGTEDQYLDDNRALDASLTALGVAHHYGESPGGHTWAYWRGHIAGVLVELSRQMR